ncbi:hypothetical protein ARMGADRAFT_1031897 [Armillaria gallica]|uniref:Uncharacterized protein n=1 Tax=Armillaria gallica TaxID=47427 RepID=A0A2H3DIA8_ARMGA|nr:hypothetical protein ARMGADRAFT_1031897 [Armillaria gallica]
MSFFTDDTSESDLELFVVFNYREPVIAFIMAHGYGFIPLQGRARDVKEVAKLHRDGDDDIATDVHISFDLLGMKQEEYYVATLLFQNSEGQQIRLYVTRGTPVLSILQCHSTCMMNFIAWNYAISLYPAATFIQGYSTSSYDAANGLYQQLVTDLEDRGFIYLDSMDDEYKK